MGTAITAERPISPERMESMIALFRRCAEGFPVWGTPLYGALSAKVAEDPALLAIADHSQPRAEGFHIFMAVHYLLSRNSNDPLAKYFATFNEHPAPPDQAFPDFKRYCAAHRDDILEVLRTRTVQQTYVERSAKLMPAFSLIADEAGEPLDLIELGCSAGALLMFDKYAFDLKGRGRLGPADATVAIPLDVRGGPPLHIPKIGVRIGLDLKPVNVKAEDEREWIISQTFPESRAGRALLRAALDVVRTSDVKMYGGDALDHLPRALAESPNVAVVFHSACLMYWSPEGKAALDKQLKDASRDRDIYRVGAEPPEDFFVEGQKDGKTRDAGPQTEVVLVRYRKGAMDRQVIAHSDAMGTFFQWLS